MELAPVPHRASQGEWRRLGLGLLIMTPVVLLVLLPAVLGLDRYVVTDDSMNGSLSRGSVVLAREVPPADLRVGDVISFAPSGSATDDGPARVTGRIVTVADGVALVRGDRGGSATTEVALDQASYARVWTSVPLIGYPFVVVDSGWVLLVLAALAAVLLAVSAGRSGRRRSQRASAGSLPSMPRLPVA